MALDRVSVGVCLKVLTSTTNEGLLTYRLTTSDIIQQSELLFNALCIDLTLVNPVFATCTHFQIGLTYAFLFCVSAVVSFALSHFALSHFYRAKMRKCETNDV